MATTVNLMGTKLDLTFPVNSSCTGRELKELLRSEFDLPLAKQTLFILPAAASGAAATPFHDHSSLADHGIADGGTADMRLEVEVKEGEEHPITVYLASPNQYPDWVRTVRCFESTTVLGLKNLVKELLEWEDFGGMALSEPMYWTAMDDDNDRIMADYLVMDGGAVHVTFNGRLLEGEKLELWGEEEEEEAEEEVCDSWTD